MEYDEIMRALVAQANPANVAGMARYGINPQHTYGVPVPQLRALAKRIGKHHALAGQLWASGIHEARLLASLVADPRQVTEQQMEQWVATFDSWDVCDQCCGNLFVRTPMAFAKAAEWSARDAEFVKRAGFALMAYLAVHAKQTPDAAFEPFLPLIIAQAGDGRNFVKKAVNWALRQIGKRSRYLNQRAIATAQAIQQLDAPAARWVAADALRDLTSPAHQQRLKR